ncbi:MAG TPA: LptF/LptG family permease [Thermoanaerobaculia bacterium]|nr:LptF/LptG family permease [Thermoanaerobaculia bacterium]HUM29977.1 LptF/LptG family permease [Thermoanaerobaculia bacterium]HXK68156.1 LptF/LptG family permease [Thermoanaerobaculia bacterium]
MSKASRYLLRTILPAVSLGVGFYLSLFLVRAFFEIIELSLRQGIPFLKASHIILLSMPGLLVMTVPMGLLFGILFAVSHLQRSNELLAFMSLGFTRKQIITPFILAGLGFAFLTAFLQIYVLPRSNSALVNYRLELLRSAMSQNINSRQFIDSFPNKILYIGDMDTSKTHWKHVTIFENDYPTLRILTAKSGDLFSDSSGMELWLKLSGVVTHITNLRKTSSPERYQINTNKEQNILLNRIATPFERSTSSKGPLEMTLTELLQKVNNPSNDFEYRRVLIELNRKLTFPAACILFAWLAMAYTFRRPQLKGTSAFVLSLLFIIIYYIVMAIGENMAAQGKLNIFIASWGPSFVLVLFALYYQFRGRRLSQGRRFSAVIPNLLSKVTFHKGLGSFPTRIDTYIWSLFVVIFLMVIVTLASLYVVIDFTQIIDEIQRHNVAFSVVWRHYLFAMPQMLYEQASPISILIALTLTIGTLERNKEFTAFRSLGISLHRTMTPFLLVALVMATVGFLFAETLMPLANKKAVMYRQIMKGKDPGKFRNIPGDYRLNMLSANHLVGYAWADVPLETLNDVFVIEWDEHMGIRRRTHADRLIWHENRWVFVDGWEREFNGDQVLSYNVFNRRDYPFPDSKSDLLLETNKPQEMNFLTLYRHLRRARAGGHINPYLQTHLWQKLVPPLSMLVLCLLAYGLIFRFPSHQTATLWQIGMSLGVGFIYWAITALFFKLGELNALPPLFAALSPVILIGWFGAYTFFDIKT